MPDRPAPDRPTGRYDCDVLVAGLGPAGAAAARAAALAGCSVLALDRRRQAGVPVQCAELVPGLIGQQAAGFTAQLHQPVQRMTTRIEHDAADVTAPFPGFMIDRAAFDAARVALAREAGAECRFGSVIRMLDRHGAQLADGTRVAARVIVGADGPASVVGRAVGRVNRELVHARQVTVPLADASDATDIFLSDDYPGGYGWLFPAGPHAHVGIGVTPAARPRLKQLLADLQHELVSAGRIDNTILRRTGGAIPVGGALAPVAALGDVPVLLAGDAAGLTNPVTGAGIHAALVSGELAGSTAADIVAGDAGAADDYADELAALFGRALSHALARRRELCTTRAGRDAEANPASRAAYRRSWIAYPEYWQRVTPAHAANEA